MSGPVGELSVEYNEHFGQWIALHLDEERAAIRAPLAPDHRTWAAGQVVAEAKDYPELYAAYLHPGHDGSSVYFTLSQWGRTTCACCAPTSAENQLPLAPPA